MLDIVPIPQPMSLPFIGNAYQIEDEVPVESFNRLADQYGIPHFTLSKAIVRGLNGVHRRNISFKIRGTHYTLC